MTPEIEDVLYLSQTEAMPLGWADDFAAARLHLIEAASDCDIGALAASFDCRAVIIATVGPAGLLPRLARQGLRPLPIVCLADFLPTEEIALLQAGAHLCLPACTGGAVVARWTAQLIGLVRRGWPSGLLLDVAARRAFYRGKQLALQPSEFDMLALVASRDDRPVSRETIEQWIAEDATPSHRRQATIAIHKFRAALAEFGGGGLVRRLRQLGIHPDS